jgi:hypothetical protein
VEGISDPFIASRTERTILHDMGQTASAEPPPWTRHSTWPHVWLPRPTPAVSISVISDAGRAAYVLAPDGELSFATYGSEHKEWTMLLPAKSLVQVEVADEALFVLSESRVTRYE